LKELAQKFASAMKGHFSELPDELLEAIAQSTDPKSFSVLRVASKKLETTLSRLPTLPFSKAMIPSFQWNSQVISEIKKNGVGKEKPVVYKTVQSTIGSVQAISHETDTTLHWLRSGFPVMSIPPRPNSNLHIYDPLHDRWLEAPDLYLVSDISFYSNWGVFYFDGESPYYAIYQFNADRQAFADTNSPLWPCLAQLKGSIEPWFEEIFNENGGNNVVFELDGSPYAAWEDSSYTMVDFQIYGDVVVLKKALECKGLIHHHFAAFLLKSKEDEEPEMLWHRLFTLSSKTSFYAVTENSVIIEVRVPGIDTRFITLDLLTGNTMMAKAISAAVAPTLERSEGKDGKLIMPRSSSHIIQSKDGQLRAWKLPKLDLVLDGIQIPLLSNSKLGTFQTPYDGSIITFNTDQSEFVVVDAKSKTVQVYSQEKNGWLMVFLDNQGISKVALLNKSL
jgi:hypothetical protein